MSGLKIKLAHEGDRVIMRSVGDQPNGVAWPVLMPTGVAFMIDGSIETLEARGSTVITPEQFEETPTVPTMEFVDAIEDPEALKFIHDTIQGQLVSYAVALDCACKLEDVREVVDGLIELRDCLVIRGHEIGYEVHR